MHQDLSNKTGKEYSKKTKALYNSKYWKENKERLKESNLKRLKEWVSKRTPAQLAFISIRKGAKKRGIPFELNQDDVIVPDKCPILGIDLKKTQGPIARNSPSVDRIDNSKGYIKGNVQVISYRANTMKNDASPEELIRFADWVYKNYKS